ncbi:DUF4421 family protein [Spirosoma pollinicola]|uniref:DUF4421 domain-containing protein n=1 Tax=Spirosoma pollinicola TaxID=2057025 RepID=A0A2K8YVR9_9BACT|nr:DUF4421 family protein [Spirosoma pollinicola]AUD01740.1 hypothetical protein CWM47_07855 [Spirosoma pollinicola]
MGKVYGSRWLLLVLLIGSYFNGSGQGLSLLGIPLDTLLKTKIPRVDRNYITTYYRQLHLYAVSDRQDYTLRVVGSPNSLIYRPNLPWSLGLGANYRWFGTEFSIKLPFFGYNNDLRGKTKPFGVTINLNNRRFWLSTQYQFYRGFYISNPDILQANWFDSHSAYPYRNDLRSQTVSSRLLYQFNPLQLSTPATLLQREEQRKGASSWNVGTSLTYQLIRADSSLVPTALQEDFRPEARLLTLKSLSVGIDLGYSRTMVYRKHYFFSFTVRPGVIVLLQQTSTELTGFESRVLPGWQGVASATLGYSSSIFYGGIYGSSTLMNRTFSQALVNTNANYIRLVFGKRIRYKPKGIIKQVPGL